MPLPHWIRGDDRRHSADCGEKREGEGESTWARHRTRTRRSGSYSGHENSRSFTRSAKKQIRMSKDGSNLHTLRVSAHSLKVAHKDMPPTLPPLCLLFPSAAIRRTQLRPRPARRTPLERLSAARCSVQCPSRFLILTYFSSLGFAALPLPPLAGWQIDYISCFAPFSPPPKRAFVKPFNG